MSEMSPEQQAALRQQQEAMVKRAQEYEERLMANFQSELGRLSGQAIVDKTGWQQKEKDWEAEREQLRSTIDALNGRVQSLESSFPTEPGDAQEAPEAATQAAADTVVLAPSAKKGSRKHGTQGRQRSGGSPAGSSGAVRPEVEAAPSDGDSASGG